MKKDITISEILSKAEKNGEAITILDSGGNAWRLKKIKSDIIKKIGGE